MPFVDSSNFRTLQLDQERQLASRYSPENEDLFGNSLLQVGATDESEPPTSVWTTERHRLLTQSVIHKSAQIYFEKTLTLNPQHINARINLANIMTQQGSIKIQASKGD